MKTFRVTKPFTLSDAAGTREYAPNSTVTEAELGLHMDALSHCITEAAAPAPPKPPKSATEPKETA